jgi:hypothetical protein
MFNNIQKCFLFAYKMVLSNNHAYIRLVHIHLNLKINQFNIILES